MRSLAVVAVLVAITPPARAEVPPPSRIAAEACDDRWLAAVPHVPHKLAGARLVDVNERLQTVLAEEARVDKLSPREAGKPLTPSTLLLLGFATGWALTLGLFAARRRSARWTALAIPIALLCGAVFMSARDAKRDALTDGARAAQLELARCHGALAEARAVLEHTQLAGCVSNLAEVDEDLTSLSATIRNGGHPTVDDVEKLRKEMSER